MVIRSLNRLCSRSTGVDLEVDLLEFTELPSVVLLAPVELCQALSRRILDKEMIFSLNYILFTT